MPALPITIGELTDVPAFDSPIASPWAQEASRRIVHRFATVAARDAAYPAAAAGVGAVCAVAGELYRSTGTRWIGTAFAGVRAGWSNNGGQLPNSWNPIMWQAVAGGDNNLAGWLPAPPSTSQVLTVPYTARWAVTFSVQAGSTPVNSTPGLLATTTGQWWTTLIGGGSFGGTWVLSLVAGETLGVGFYNGGPSINLLGGGLHITNVGGI